MSQEEEAVQGKPQTFEVDSYPRSCAKGHERVTWRDTKPWTVECFACED